MRFHQPVSYTHLDVYKRQRISGAVMYPNTVSFEDGKTLKYYIEQAGGYGLRAKKSKAYIVYMLSLIHIFLVVLGINHLDIFELAEFAQKILVLSYIKQKGHAYLLNDFLNSYF